MGAQCIPVLWLLAEGLPFFCLTLSNLLPPCPLVLCFGTGFGRLSTPFIYLSLIFCLPCIFFDKL